MREIGDLDISVRTICKGARVLDRAEVDRLINAGFVTKRKHPNLDLFIFNYTHKCQYKRYWTPTTIRCRGLITDGGFNVIANPFPKFFNLGEIDGLVYNLLPGETPQVTEKLDGSLGILYDDMGAPAIATRGTFDSEMAQFATKWIRGRNLNYTDFLEGYTYLFEIIYPENKIVCDYGGTSELFLLAVRHTLSGYEINHEAEASRIGIKPVKTFPFTLDVALEKLEILDGKKQEGFVLKYSNGLRVKLKNEQYVKLHRAISNFSPKRVIQSMIDNEFEVLIDTLPDELYGEAKEIFTNTTQRYNEILSETKIIMAEIRNIKTRKDQAKAILEHPSKSLLFILLDNNHERAREHILKSIMADRKER